MHIRRSKSLLVLPVFAGLLFAACGSDGDDADDTAAPTTAAGTSPVTTAAPETSAAAGSTPGTGGGEAVSLSGACPAVITLQTDWMPEAEHGFVYQLIGEEYEIDKANAAVEGPLVDSAGNDTGVRMRVQSGGGAQQFQNVTTLMYSNDDLLLGYIYTDEAIQNSDKFPTVAIESGFEKNPQMIMWDPATYPDVKGIADLGEEGVTIRYFGGAAYMDYFTSTGLLSKDQVDGSYQGDPALFVADEGKAAQQGFGSAEPYIYENEIDGWGKPVAYEYINDAGWENYAESIATRPENIDRYRECFELLVPMIQQASVDYLNDPARTNALILAAVDSFGGDFGWTYTEGTVEYGVETIKKDGLVANGPDDIIGNFDMDRVNELIEKAIPVYTAQDSPPKEGLTAEDIVTNEFIDESIGL